MTQSSWSDQTPARERLAQILGTDKAVIAMIHVGALPGTPAYAGSVQQVIDQAVGEAEIYRSGGVDALAIENMHDTPYLRAEVGPEVTAAMAVVGREVKRAAQLPCGVQVLAGANEAALAAAQAAGLDFVRAEGFVFAHVADEGLIESCAGALLRYRAKIGAQDILVLTDIKKKHSAHAITGDVSIAETARAAELFRSDGVVVTGTATGSAADPGELEAVFTAVSIPVVVGSGVTLDNLDNYFSWSDALIVGSHFKLAGRWENPPDPERVATLMDRVTQLRQRG